MPRTARPSTAGYCFHVMTRGNARARVFHDDADYELFAGLLFRAKARLRMRVLAWCLMPNHVHAVLWPRRDGDLGRWMHWLLTTHVQRHRARYGTVGRIWQGRFKSCPVQKDRHLIVVLRYVERNPLRAGLVDRSDRWPWSSLCARTLAPSSLLDAPPVDLPSDWSAFVHRPHAEAELAHIREAVARGRPIGDRAWIRGTAERLGLQQTLRPRGRPPAFRSAATFRASRSDSKN